jgi:hypothetical protein
MDADTVVGFLIILAGIYMIIFRKSFTQSIVDFQNSLFKVDFTPGFIKLLMWVNTAFGILFVLVGILRLSKIAF